MPMPHSVQQGPADPKLWFHCLLATAVFSDSDDCHTFSPGNNQANSSKSVVLHQEQMWPPTDTGQWPETYIWLSQTARGRVLLASMGNGRGAAKYPAITHQLPPQRMIWSHMSTVPWLRHLSLINRDYDSSPVNSSQDYINPNFGNGSSIQHCPFLG